MVSASVLEKLRMLEIIKRAIPLDAVSEGRLKRRSLRFRPGDGFCEPSLRYLSLISKGQVSQTWLTKAIIGIFPFVFSYIMFTFARA